MQRKQRPETTSYYSPKPVRLHLDEIDAMVSCLREVCDSVDISTDTHEGISELTELQDPRLRNTRSLSITGRRESLTYATVSVSGPDGPFGSPKANIWLSSSDAQARGVFAELAEQLRRCRTTVWWGRAALATYGAGVLLLAANLALSGPSFVDMVVDGLYALGVVTWCAHYFQRRTVVVLSWRKDAPTFLKRNADAILLNLFFCVVSFALGFLAKAIAG